MPLGRLTTGFLAVASTAVLLTAGVASSAAAAAPPDVTVYVQNFHSGKCAAVPGGIATRKTQLVQWNCDPFGTNRQWSRHAVGLDHYGNWIYILKNVKTKQCLTSAGRTGGPVWQYPCSNGANQRWSYDNALRLHSNSSGDCLAVPGAQKGDGVKLIHWRCGTGYEQKWDMGK
ncbi:RICIN domain-containing protein [Kribbella sp. NPDC058245]|uniref:RICIN domain-containing protein n=1 Tax=Kribbella sp. NPDC058245 TaxID=3346399 RepID=UPI0036EB9C33